MFFKKRNTGNLSDEELVRQYRNSHDKSLVGVLYERHSHLVFGVCLKYLKNREESRDAVLNLFEKLLEDLKHHSVDNFKSWMHSVARNHCLMILRKTNRPGFEKDIDELQEKLQEETGNDPQLKEEQLQSLEQVIPQLNAEQRICIELFYLKELSYQEVVQETGFTMNQVKSNIQNGKRNLKILLTKQNEIFVK